MLIWQLHDEDFSGFIDILRARDLRVLFYIHGGARPLRRYANDAALSLQNMIDARVHYITSTGLELPRFKELVSLRS